MQLTARYAYSPIEPNVRPCLCPRASVNINTADSTSLASLSGIGQSKAEAIVKYREANGPFASAQDLTNVKGIGLRTVEKNTGRLTTQDTNSPEAP